MWCGERKVKAKAKELLDCSVTRMVLALACEFGNCDVCYYHYHYHVGCVWIDDDVFIRCLDHERINDQVHVKGPIWI